MNAWSGSTGALARRVARAFSLALVACLAVPAALAAAPADLDKLLATVKSGRAADAAENARRIAEFKAAASEQARMMEAVKGERSAEEQRSQSLEAAFAANDTQIVELEKALNERLGSLKELFGVLQQVSGDTRAQFENSLTQVQFPERTQFLADLAQKMGGSNRLASLEEIEQLWFELQREMTESGKVVRVPVKVVGTDGKESDRNVVRVGVFNLVADGKYLEFLPETGRVVELARQPQARFLASAANVEQARDGLVAMGLDPSRGQILSLLVQSPSLRERMDQGGPVGYVTMALGVLALLITVERLFVLGFTGMSMARQARRLDAPGNNPLGRVAQVYRANPEADTEVLELKLSEAIMKEVPRFTRWLMPLKIIAVVAPLLGLLGTVTGMIITFQAITLFGTGDPKLMAGGISQALVTTVQGLCVAIPTVLLHTLVASRAKRLTQVLEEQAAGMLAGHAEAMRRAA
ncbi:MAG: MotA/TolQ/ExbB proton channel family protein [Gammaproteobacteria bacterium]